MCKLHLTSCFTEERSGRKEDLRDNKKKEKGKRRTEGMRKGIKRKKQKKGRGEGGKGEGGKKTSTDISCQLPHPCLIACHCFFFEV